VLREKGSEDAVGLNSGSSVGKSSARKDWNDRTALATGGKMETEGRRRVGEDLKKSGDADTLLNVDSFGMGTAVKTTGDGCEKRKAVIASGDSCEKGRAVLVTVDSCEKGTAVMSSEDSCKMGTAGVTTVDGCEKGTASLSTIDSCKMGTASLPTIDSCKKGRTVMSTVDSCWQAPVLARGKLPPTSSSVIKDQLPHQFRLNSCGLLAIPPYYPKPKKG